MSFTVIDRHDLQPGQWVVFTHDREKVSEELQGPFKVISRCDVMFDICRCFLMNIEGDLVDYCPRVCSLAYKDLPYGYSVKVASSEDIGKELGKKVESVQKSAIDHLKRLAQSKYFGKGFNPEESGATLTGAQIREKYSLTLNK